MDPQQAAHQSDNVGWTEARHQAVATAARPLALINGRQLEHAVLEYEQYGRMNTSKSNVILVTHALSGDAHAAGWDAHAERDDRLWRRKTWLVGCHDRSGQADRYQPLL